MKVSCIYRSCVCICFPAFFPVKLITHQFPQLYMERLQIILLVISSSWFLTCDTENTKGNSDKRTDSINQFIADSILTASNDSSVDFIRMAFFTIFRKWIQLDGNDKMPRIFRRILDNYALSVYMKKSGSVLNSTIKAKKKY